MITHLTKMLVLVYLHIPVTPWKRVQYCPGTAIWNPYLSIPISRYTRYYLYPSIPVSGYTQYYLYPSIPVSGYTQYYPYPCHALDTELWLTKYLL
jgi:hypothetical protein